MHADRKLDLLFLFAALLFMGAIWFTTPITSFFGGQDWDGRFYVAAALGADGDPSFQHRAPWCWRVLTPVLASLLPFDILLSFRIVHLVSYLLVAVLIVDLGRKLEFGPSGTFLVLGGYFACYWTVKSSFYSPAYIDGETQLFAWLLLWCGYRGRVLLCCVALAAATLQKETALGMILPVWILLFGRIPYGARRQQAATMQLILLSAVGAAVYLWVRATIPSVHPYHPEALVRTIVTEQLLRPELWKPMALEVLSGGGVLFVLPFLFPGRTLHILRIHPEITAIIGVGLLALLGGFDKARLTLFMLPGFSLLVGLLWRELGEHRLVVFMAGACVLLQIFFQRTLGTWTDHQAMVSYYLPLIARDGAREMAVAAMYMMVGLAAIRFVLYQYVEPQGSEAERNP